MGSGIKLKESMVPLSKLAKIVKKVKNPKREFISWNATESVEKYFTKFPNVIYI